MNGTDPRAAHPASPGSAVLPAAYTSVPAQVGPYEPQQLLATGGHSAVWLATGPSGPVALKLARNEDGRRGLKREAELLKTIRHPNLVQLVETDPGGEWIALEVLDGRPVDQWARGRSLDDIVDLGVGLLDVLAHLHQHAVVHGDVKPSNVLVGASGKPKLLDLGIALTAGQKVEGFRGTLGYAAPELLDGKPPSPASDIYGLGALLYTLLAGRLPFVAADPAALTYLPQVSLPPPPATFRTDLPAPLNQLVLTMLARAPERRPLDPAKLREALLKCKGGLPGPPVLGMSDEREELRRAVVAAADGEVRVVVVYGVPGSGRRTLIAEAVESARREGMPYLKGTDPTSAAQALREAGRPSVLVLKASHRGARQLAEALLRDVHGCLLLLHADRPIPGLTAQGAVQITPAPLNQQEAVKLAEVWAADIHLAEAWWRQSMGLPIALLGRIRAWRRAQGKSQTQHAPLPAESRRIFDALRLRPNLKALVLELAAELQMTEHVLLDHAEVLFAEELIEPAEDGLAVQVVRARSAT